jgi:alpha-L-fucosidase
MEERLIEIGDWLAVNGEAIYGTTTHSQTCQWTEGNAQELGKGNYRVKYDVDKLMKNPDEGMARKEALFTRKGDALYAICAILPDEQLVLRGIEASDGATVSMLGVGEVEWKQVDADLVITMPKLNASRMPCQHAWTFKISSVE